MSLKMTAKIGASVGLATCAAVMALMWYGVSGVLYLGHTDFMYVLWPSSLILVGGWRTTPFGIAITTFSVLVNCATYAAAGILLRWGIQSLAGLWRAEQQSR